MRVSWAAVAGAAHYRLAILTEGEDPNNEAHWDNYGGDLTGISLDVGGLHANTAYMFRAKACNVSGCSAGVRSPWVRTPCHQPAAPSDLRPVDVWPHAFHVAWTHNQQHVTDFQVQVQNLDGTWQSIDGPGMESRRVPDRCPGRAYRVRVRARNVCGDFSPFSPELVVTTTAPAAPTGFQATRVGDTPNPDPIRCTWSYAGPHPTGFRIARCGPFTSDIGAPAPGDSRWNQVGSVVGHDAREWTDNSAGRQAGRYYYYRVRAYTEGPCGVENFDTSNPEVARP